MAILNTNLTTLRQIAGITPFSTHLFQLNYFGRDVNSSNPNGFELANAGAYCTSVDFGGKELNLEFNDPNPYSFEHYIKAVKNKAISQVKITWREHRDLRVWNYHRSWMNRWYNQAWDVFPTGAEGKKREAYVTVQRSDMLLDNAEYEKSNYVNFVEEDIHTFLLKGMVPTSMPTMPTLKYGDPTDVTYTITYAVDRIVYRAILPTNLPEMEEGIGYEYANDEAWKYSTQNDSSVGLLDATGRIV